MIINVGCINNKKEHASNTDEGALTSTCTKQTHTINHK